MDSLQRKGINFDLNTQALKEYYPKGDWHNAYADVNIGVQGVQTR